MAQELKTLLLQGPAGGYIVSHPELTYAKVITVKRNGSRQYQVTTNPTGGNANVRHDSALGKLIFSSDLPFNFSEVDETGARKIEYVHVIYTRNSLQIGTQDNN